jgi:hypothetical protein
VTPGRQVKEVVEIGQRAWQAEDEPLMKEADWGGARYREWRPEQLAMLLGSTHQLCVIKTGIDKVTDLLAPFPMDLC